MTVNEVGSLAARTVSHEAIYRFIYALPKGELAAHGVMLRSKRTRRRAPKPGGQRGAPIVGMVSIEDRADLSQRRVPGHWEGDLIIGAHGRSAAATLVERTTRFTTILALPAGKDSEHLVDALIDNTDELPAILRKSLTWDQGSQMAKHAAVTLATKMPPHPTRSLRTTPHRQRCDYGLTPPWTAAPGPLARNSASRPSPGSNAPTAADAGRTAWAG